ncbi:hypothetical protein ACFTQ7_01485, partial [Lysinibacillus sp. NPDC056959]|uniref:hypothetical protein n=1 Tax=Lysinibacillus sp. NPDC056959 TaxID=3345981 RepID=UPI00362E5B1C
VRKRSDSTMLVTEALSQDVMLLASVPLLLIPKESPSRNEDQLFYMIYVLTKCHLLSISNKKLNGNLQILL